jgi:predicted DNA binding CopG/RHH family protein
MAIKTTFEPKDPRITFEDSDEGDDDWTSDEKPRKRKTGTQALVEFLNTTSPEEFQKGSPKRSTALFFRRRTNKSAKVLGSAPTMHRKNYIEIIANPFMFNKSKPPNNTTATAATSATTPCTAAVVGSQLNHTLSKSSASIYSNAAHAPPLPTKKGISNKDMYSIASAAASLHSISTQTSRSPSVLTKSSLVLRRQPSLRVDKAEERKTLPVNILPMIHDHYDDVIEGGLKYRLNQYKRMQLDKPSDMISKSITQEHTAALEILFSLTNQNEDSPQPPPIKRRPRHVQVQTMPYMEEDAPIIPIKTPKEEDDDDDEEMEQQLDHQEIKQRLEKVEKELKQEKLINSRLEAALEETRDEYELLSGLAYKKLREVWEEKVRWENACIEAKERCWHDHQQQILGNLEDSQCPMEFLLEEEEEDEEENIP